MTRIRYSVLKMMLETGPARQSRKMLAGVGVLVLERCRAVQYLAAVLAATLFNCAQPRRWGRTARGVFSRQFFSFGVESVPFILILAVLVGISVVVQLWIWTGRLGQSQKLGPLLVTVVARELGPLFANFVLIVRGGSAIATELGIMNVGGEVRVLDAQGVDPLAFLVMPRVLAMALSAFCLTVIFVFAAFASGYAFSAFFGHASVSPGVFLVTVFKAVHPFEAIGFLVKCLLPALLTGVICSTQGLSVEGGVSQVPVAAKRALAQSLFALFLTSAIVSLLAYS
jgi:phospholipid/cholesterol/gamma-HCH transport system permease protein